jgi:histidine triad (HIT) family protein
MENNCVFCQIIEGKVKADIVHKDEVVAAFRDRNPHAPVHLLIIPTKHIRSINDLTEGDEGIVSAMIATARHLAGKFSIKTSGYKLVFNVEKGGGQVIFHLHLHLLGGWQV